MIVTSDIVRSYIENTFDGDLLWPLILRGMYIFEVRVNASDPNLKHTDVKSYAFKEDQTDKNISILSHWGICTIDIKDGELTYQGIRLYTNEKINIPKSPGYRLWQSEFSKISPGKKAPHVYFGYVTFDKDEKKSVSASVKRIFTERLYEAKKTLDIDIKEDIDKLRAKALGSNTCSDDYVLRLCELLEKDFRLWDDYSLLAPPTDYHLDNLLREYNKERIEYDKSLLKIITTYKELIKNASRSFLLYNLNGLLLSNRDNKNDQIISITHTKCEDWLPSDENKIKRKGRFEFVTPQQEKTIVACSGEIIWTPLSSL